MKRKVLKLAYVFLSGLMLVSCSKDNVSEISKNTSSADLKKKLTIFNDSHKTSNKVAYGRGWRNLLKIVGADLVGTASGLKAGAALATTAGLASGGTGFVVVEVTCGVIGGGSASLAAYDLLHPDQTTSSYEEAYGDMELYNPVELAYLANMGIDHNYLLNQFLLGNSAEESYYGNFPNESRIVIEDFENGEDFQKIRDGIQVYADNDYDASYLLNYYYNEGLLSLDVRDIEELFLAEIDTCTNYDEIEEVINYYIMAINSSSLTDLDKKSLFASFMVASESPYYWSHNFDFN